MSKKETIEIPLDVARAYAIDHTPGNIADLQRAIRDALPKTREERLGLPWGGPEHTSLVGWRVPVGGDNDDHLHARNRHQAKLIACAPEMAKMLEELFEQLQGVSIRDRVEDLLLRAGWLEE